MSENDLNYLKKIAKEQLMVLCMLADQINSVQGLLNSPRDSAVYYYESEEFQSAFDIIIATLK